MGEHVLLLCLLGLVLTAPIVTGDRTGGRDLALALIE
jgi:hypothetical protein